MKAAHWTPGPLLALLLACNESDVNLVKQEPNIYASVDSLPLGEVEVETTSTEIIEIGNGGVAELNINTLEMRDNADNAYVLTYEFPNGNEGVVPSGETMAVQVDFNPIALQAYDRELVVTSDDPDTPELIIPITAIGVDGPVPDIELPEAELDFGTELTETTTTIFTIANVGDGPLTLGDMIPEGSGQFHYVNLPDPGTVVPAGSDVTVIVEYEPTEFGDSATLAIQSDDPDEPTITLSLTANGGGDGAYPTAVIDCPGDQDPPSTVTLDGSASTDPLGLPIVAYEWSLVEQPTGSVSQLSTPDALSTDLDVDLSGAWEVDLVVTNEAGVRSAPARCTFRGIPQAELQVELSWDTDESDLDLHLVRRGGEGYYSSEDDCCHCNDNPDWGVSGESADDCVVTTDNETGYGPERILIDEPAEGEYEVWVHYFSDRDGGQSEALVTVWLDGTRVKQAAMDMEHNDTWLLGYVRWPDKVFLDTEETSEDSPYRACY
jgi:hypothetical protein